MGNSLYLLLLKNIRMLSFGNANEKDLFPQLVVSYVPDSMIENTDKKQLFLFVTVTFDKDRCEGDCVKRFVNSCS